MCAFVSAPAQLHSVSTHACTWSTFKSLYSQPSVGVSAHVRTVQCACTVCVCLTIFVSVFSSRADPASDHLHVFAAGAAVELVDPVVSPTHGVSHLRLVLHMHAEVDPIHTEYLLLTYTHTDTHTQRHERAWKHCMYHQHTTCLSYCTKAPCPA